MMEGEFVTITIYSYITVGFILNSLAVVIRNKDIVSTIIDTILYCTYVAKHCTGDPPLPIISYRTATLSLCNHRKAKPEFMTGLYYFCLHDKPRCPHEGS